MEIVLAIINAALLWAVWYFLGRCSIYRMIIEDYKELLDIASGMKITIEAYEAKYNTKETEQEDGEQD